jgi:hypothetical protein
MRMSANRQVLTRVAATAVLSGGPVVGTLGPAQANYGDPEAQYTAELSEGVPKPNPFRLQWRVLIGWVVIRSMLESATQFAPRKEAQIIALLLTGLGDLVVTIRQLAKPLR